MQAPCPIASSNREWVRCCGSREESNVGVDSFRKKKKLTKEKAATQEIRPKKGTNFEGLLLARSLGRAGYD